MPRDFADSVKGTIETPLGPVDFNLTQADHVFLFAGFPHDPSPAVEVHRVKYMFHLHLYLKPDGSWERNNDSDLYMNRSDRIHSGASHSAREKLYELVRQAWQDFIAGQEIPLVDAEMSHLNNEIRSVDEELRTLMEKVGELNGKKEELLARERAMMEHRTKFIRRGGYPRSKDWSPSGRLPQPGEPE